MRRQVKHLKPASLSERVFGVLSYVLMTIFALVCILPCLNIFSTGISNGTLVTTGGITFWPRQIQWDTMGYIVKKTAFFNALKNSLVVTIIGTLVSMFTTITTAYPLAQTHLPGRKCIIMLYVFSMVFFGGIVPAYMVVNSLGILDTYAALILPFAIVHFNMFVMKSYFEGLPESVSEAATIDGATDTQTLCQIVLPMSKSVLATVGLLYAVNYWNNYFHAMMYTKSASMRTLQVYLYDLIQNGQSVLENLTGAALGSAQGNYEANITTQGVTAAAVTLSIIPIVALYPFVQRYVVQGITLGSVKG